MSQTSSAAAEQSWDDPSLDPRLVGFLRARWGATAALLRIEALAGDASTRRYFRIHEGPASVILALYPQPWEPGPIPFLDVQHLLANWGLPVPAVLACDRERGVMLLSDLGDDSLQERLRTADARERETLYAQALHQLEHLQHAAAGWPERQAECYRLAFDVPKLRFELDFFVRHFLIGLRGSELDDGERNALDAGFELLCAEIASWPRVLCHRDFHSRNLILHQGTLHWIDFQDARLGPAVYDLASLLRDAYVTLDEDFIAARVEEFRRLARPSESRAEFVRRFEWACVQRNLKALGTFGYMTTVHGKRVYHGYVAPTLQHLRRNLGRHAAFDGLRHVLGRHLPELEQTP